MIHGETSHRLLIHFAAGAALCIAAACQPKAPPPKLPPKEVPRLQRLGSSEGQRVSVVDDAVQVGSNLARITYDCGPPYGSAVEGGGTLSPQVTRCEIDLAQKTVTFTGDASDDCNPFLLTISDYHGAGTYNTASLGRLSFGVAKVRQSTCNWEGSLCMDWDRQSNVHPEANCTVEINADGGLQYGTVGATVSGTFVCSAFLSTWKGCAGVSAKAGCGIRRGSFSVAGCTRTQAQPQGQAPPRKRRR